MRRSTLQRKDRDELTEIAAALGRKPPSRARKGEIIDLIIDLAAGGDGSSVLAAPAGSEKSDGDAGDDSKGSAAPDEEVASGESEAAPTDGDQADESDAKGRDSDRGRDEQPDPGNRRRRRRGRDRDRDRDEGWDGEPAPVAGYLDLRDEGYGFLRVDGALPSKLDAYVPVKMIRQLGLRKGDHISGTSRPANRNEKNPALLNVETVNGAAPEEAADRPFFEDLVPVVATEQLQLEQPDDPDNVAARVIDLIAPIGKGQRVLVVAPPRTGATTLMKQIVQSIETNDPEVTVIGLLLDERPEEATEMSRFVQHGEVISTSFGQPAEEHVQVAEMTIERAKRMAERGEDVVLVFDGLTRLARAYNQTLSNAGRAYSGNVESGAVHLPKKLFAAGRCLEDSGSLTIVATVLADTDNDVDEVILGEFAGTANTEIRLDRWAAARGIFPAIDVTESASRNEERLLDEDELEAVRKLRADLAGAAGDGPGAAVATLEALLERLSSASTNSELLR
jgi:transcription termination factor Rho